MATQVTEIEAAVVGALQALGFERILHPPGGPAKLNVTDATVKKVQSLIGTVLVVAPNGEITEEKPSATAYPAAMMLGL